MVPQIMKFIFRNVMKVIQREMSRKTVVAAGCSLVDLWSCSAAAWHAHSTSEPQNLPEPPESPQNHLLAPHLHAIHFLKCNFHCFARVYLAVSLGAAQLRFFLLL